VGRVWLPLGPPAHLPCRTVHELRIVMRVRSEAPGMTREVLFAHEAMTPSGARVPSGGRARENPLVIDRETARVPDEGLDPILIQVTIPLPVPMIFAAFTDAAKLTGWLCDAAVASPHVGGEYRLRFDGPPAFESAGTITRLTPDVDIGFGWRAPPPFVALMNEPTPRTEVYVRLQESPEGIDVTLEHSGWGGDAAWEEARSWHFHFWDERLGRLKAYLIREAYG